MKKALLFVFLASFLIVGFSQVNPVLKYVTDCDTTFIYDKDIRTSKKNFQSLIIFLQGEILKKLSENNCHFGQLFYFKDNDWILLKPQPIRSETLPEGYYYLVFENGTFINDEGRIRLGYYSPKKTKRMQAAERRYRRKVDRIFGAPPF